MTLMRRIHIETFSQVIGQVPMICYHRVSNVFKSRSRGKVDDEWFFSRSPKTKLVPFRKRELSPIEVSGFWGANFCMLHATLAPHPLRAKVPCVLLGAW